MDQLELRRIRLIITSRKFHKENKGKKPVETILTTQNVKIKNRLLSILPPSYLYEPQQICWRTPEFVPRVK